MHWSDWHAWGMGWMGFWWLLIAAAIVAVIILAPSARRGEGSTDPPERIVKRRYARGEIDRATYERMLEDLRR